MYKCTIKNVDSQGADRCYYFKTSTELLECSSFKYFSDSVMYIELEKVSLRKMFNLAKGWNKVRLEKEGVILCLKNP